MLMCVAFGWEVSSPKLSVLKGLCSKFGMANLYGDRDFYWESQRYGLYTSEANNDIPCCV